VEHYHQALAVRRPALGSGTRSPGSCPAPCSWWVPCCRTTPL
jgi:hypothetical protein